MGRSDNPEDIVDESQNGITAFRRMQAQHDRETEFDLLDLAVVVRRGWLTIFACMALFLGLAEYYGTYHHHPAFAAEAELLADVRAGTSDTAAQSLAMADTVLSSRVEVITSSASLHALAQELGLVADPGLRQADDGSVIDDSVPNAVMQALSDALEVERAPGSRVLVIRAEAPDADLARLLANTLVDMHIDAEFSRRTGDADRRIAALSSEMDGLEDEIRQRIVEKDLVLASPETQESFRAVQDLAEDLRNTRDILAAMNGVAQGAARRPSPAQTARLEEIEAQVGRILETQPLQALQQLERTLEVLRRRQAKVSEEYLSLRADRHLLRPGVEVLSYATGAVAVGPPQSLVRILALTTGAMLGAALLLWRRFVHSGVRTRAEMRLLSGGSPLVEVLHSRRPRRKTLTAVMAGGTEVAGSEGVRDLREAVLKQYRPGRGSAIMLTSSRYGEGVTTLSAALAHGLASLCYRVLLIEGDLRKPRLAARLGVDVEAGLDEVLTGYCSVDGALVQLTKPDPKIICAGFSETPADVASDLLATPALGDLIAEARRTYDFIVVAAPPVLGTSDARLIARTIDAAIYVAEWDRTRREMIADGQAALSSIPVPLACCVMNKVRPRRLRRLGY